MLEAGTVLGPYEIVQPLGAGGMGEVYKARDTRLDRIVAIKVLPAHLSDNPENRERFEREARAISALSHAHICTLHDIGRQGDIDFLVMEYLEGETLAARLSRGALPIDQALTLAIQIADALDRAHRQGIVHRDLKPANVMLLGTSGVRPGASRSGPLQAKLLDFGLAKLSDPPNTAAPGSMVPTILPSADLTARGTILGTLQYMAPEQLEGLEADARTDIFAFGTLVYEMATGRKAFEGKSQPSLISAIMSADAPSISAVQSMSPPALDHLVKTCLAKDPADRWQTMHDVMAQLKWIAEGGSQAGVPAPVVAARRTRGRLLIGALAVAIVSLAALATPAFLYWRGAPVPDLIRFSVETPSMPNPAQLAISPDGRMVAFQGRSARGMAIFIRRLDSTSIETLAGTEGGGLPFWSPDSRSLGFFAGSKLRKIAITGGAPLDLAEGTGAGAWGTQGTILFSRAADLYAVPESGGEPALVELDTSPPHLFPQFLPDGRHFVFTSGGANPGSYVAVLGSKTTRLLVPVRSSAVYANPGFLLFLRQGSLFAQPFNASTQALSGDPIHIVDDVFAGTGGRAALSVSQNGVLLYRGRTGTFSNQQFVWFDRSGRQTGLAGKPDAYNQNFDLSPDGRQIALSIFDQELGGQKMWVMDWVRGIVAPVTFRLTGRDVVWSPDGLQLAFTGNSAAQGSGGRTPGTGFDILLKKSSGLGQEEVLVSGPRDEYVEDWSKDGRFITYVVRGLETNAVDIWAVPLFGDRKPFPVIESPFNKDEPHFSPDGKWLVYESVESGPSQIYVTSFPEADQKRQISDSGGTQPRWHGRGTELYYLSLDGKMMAVDIATSPRLDSGTPHVLFDTGIPVIQTVDQYAVTSDGQRFLVLKPLSEQVEPPLSLIVNWTRLLKQ